MIEHRPFADLDGADLGWLKARQHFSAASLDAPGARSMRPLLIWNDDEFAAASGFPMHPHQNMEIITYVRQGAITHQDSLGNTGRTAAGDVQVMSAGTGIRHAEFNAESTPTLLFQIWIAPRTPGGAPRWDNKQFPQADRGGQWVALASGSPDDAEALPINSDARVLGATLRRGELLVHALAEGRRAYLVAASGALDVDGVRLAPRDGAAIAGQRSFTVNALEDTEIVMVELY